MKNFVLTYQTSEGKIKFKVKAKTEYKALLKGIIKGSYPDEKEKVRFEMKEDFYPKTVEEIIFLYKEQGSIIKIKERKTIDKNSVKYLKQKTEKKSINSFINQLKQKGCKVDSNVESVNKINQYDKCCIFYENNKDEYRLSDFTCGAKLINSKDEEVYFRKRLSIIDGFGKKHFINAETYKFFLMSDLDWYLKNNEKKYKAIEKLLKW